LTGAQIQQAAPLAESINYGSVSEGNEKMHVTECDHAGGMSWMKHRYEEDCKLQTEQTAGWKEDTEDFAAARTAGALI
jgi:hypothetical protein